MFITRYEDAVTEKRQRTGAVQDADARQSAADMPEFSFIPALKRAGSPRSFMSARRGSGPVRLITSAATVGKSRGGNAKNYKSQPLGVFRGFDGSGSVRGTMGWVMVKEEKNMHSHALPPFDFGLPRPGRKRRTGVSKCWCVGERRSQAMRRAGGQRSEEGRPHRLPPPSAACRRLPPLTAAFGYGGEREERTGVPAYIGVLYASACFRIETPGSRNMSHLRCLGFYCSGFYKYGAPTVLEKGGLAHISSDQLALARVGSHIGGRAEQKHQKRILPAPVNLQIPTPKQFPRWVY